MSDFRISDFSGYMFTIGVEDRSKISNMMWASVRNAHKKSKDNKLVNRLHTHRRTYAEVVTPVSE